ncbi:AbgT family transporter [Kocuria rhizophila]|uniref:AbgT family transporter n=1 Tax=Kocuria rhizophila TaxID=72000 RepID=UPI00057E71AC|nr:AbgT family transporter [Kocuria rhizophila]KIC66492.1 P-aminobenzoyl-glutamate transporter [Kocuria rhizophila]KUP28559.1 P-aminobenzoyl-glutamate transporter [Kocuria rhizophila]MCR4525839.1 AbgT family transporter [Kocuria rhizophila]MDA4827795.1 AbgT family transporter [Kocuria rhizophila]RLP60509.1 AbgT family transporter [Kocuria rhizophila]
MNATATKRSLGDRFLTGIERVGNKLPEPFALFTILFLITAVVSTAMAWAGVVVQVPGKEDPVVIQGLFTGDGIAWFTTTLGENYIGFPPLVTVATILLAIGIAEKSGFLAAAIRFAIGSAPRWMLPYTVGFVGVVGSIMADSAFVVIPPLAALAFKAAGRHPVAGLLGGFAAAGAGYSTNIFPTSLDALFAGITNAVIPTVPALAETATEVNPLSNYYFNIVSALVLSLVAGWVIDKIVEPRVERAGVSRDEVSPETQQLMTDTRAIRIVGDEQTVAESQEPDVEAALSPREKKALLWGGVTFVLIGVVLAVFALVPNSPWRNEDGGFLPKSPLLSSIVFIIFAFFSVSGYVYGRVAGTVRGYKDVPVMMGAALRDMTSFLVLAFVLGQFIALFNWSGIGSWIAVSGATALENAGVTGFPVIIGFILLCSLLNLFIISGSSMWTLMAAVFVPMFGILGFEPAFIQAAFRVGDSATQVMTPLNPYMVVLLTMLRKYEPSAGLGTVMARMIPFVVPFWVVWVIILVVFYVFGLPLGPGVGIMIGD